MRKIIYVLLSLCLCFGLCACGQKVTLPQGGSITQAVTAPDPGDASIDVENELSHRGVSVTSGMEELTAAVDLYNDCVCSGGNVWIRGWLHETGAPVLVRLDLDNGRHTVLELSVPASDAERVAAPPEDERLAIIYSLIGTDEEYPLLLRTVLHLEDNDEVYNVLYSDHMLCTVTAEGVVNEGVVLAVEQPGDNLWSGCADGSGIWFLASRREADGRYPAVQLRGYDPATGQLLTAVELPENWYGSSLRPLGNGDFVLTGGLYTKPGSMMYPEDERLLLVRDAAGAAMVDEPFRFPVPVGADVRFLPSNGCTQIYLDNRSGLWQWDVERNRLIQLYQWNSVGFEPAEGSLFPWRTVPFSVSMHYLKTTIGKSVSGNLAARIPCSRTNGR